MRNIALLLLLAFSTNLKGQYFNISLKNGTYKEQKGKEQFERIIKQYRDQIEKWIFTTKIVIDEINQRSLASAVIR